jgi:UDP-glucose 4-epimerase
MVAQNLLRKWQSARPACRLRSSTGVIYGPNPKGNKQTLARPARLPVPLPTASFVGRRSLLGIDNLNSAIIFALENSATLNETCLLADRTPMTIDEILVVLRKK